MVESEITQLAMLIREAVIKHKKTGSLQTRRLVRVRRRDFSLKYHEDFGFASFPPERIEEDIWDGDDLLRFQESVVKMTKEYTSLLSALGPKRGNLLELFTRNVSITSFQGLEDEELSTRVSAFARELDGQPLPVKLTAFLDGLSITDSPVVISDRFILRRPTPDDLAETILLDEYGGFSFPQGETWFRVIGELTFDAIDTGAAQRECLRTLEALSLFQIGGIEACR